jgi:hypothetical protein
MLTLQRMARLDDGLDRIKACTEKLEAALAELQRSTKPREL